MRYTAGADLASLLQDLCTAAPGLCVHLELPGTLAEDCAARARCVVRCVQEILTNALRDAHARNLWIVVTQSRGPVGHRARDSRLPPQGTARELEVLRLLAGGHSNREIAVALHVAEGTIKNHVSSILAKTGVRDRTRAALKAAERGYV